MNKRNKWKIRNLGCWGYLKASLKKNKKVYFKGNVTTVEKRSQVFMEDKWENFMLVKPSGANKLNKIIGILTKKHYIINEILEIKDYNQLMIDMFPNVNPLEVAYWKQINDEFYKDPYGNIKAYILIFDKNVSVEQLEKEKIFIRRKCGIDIYDVIDGEKPVYETSITPIHVPDKENMRKEYFVAFKYSSKKIH
ncbi:hypothetical protein SAMN02745248_00342 [Hathewaya proteolytica DSM 3090]|uniref:Uncharacterized protein n=1 Tax=Hathewaya proteolytica DSM 3090 TaxID=1121331 RepID=A0A1M6K5E7_9CLOT|nr:hypothetical protein [Hathewaya proteolytica]SHJ54178.1 hypothetical protein SAMN02745248_00342 [Hathewaya proteolytica DSM 3090]